MDERENDCRKLGDMVSAEEDETQDAISVNSEDVFMSYCFAL